MEDNEYAKKSGPWVVIDPVKKREYLSIEPLVYYVHQIKEGGWIVIDRRMDVSTCGPFKTRALAIKEFYKANGRPIPKGEKIPR